VQKIGKVLVIYRENPEEAKPKSPPRPPPRPGERLDRAKEKQRARDEKKRRGRDIEDMIRKGKIDAKAKLGAGAKLGPRLRGDDGAPMPALPVAHVRGLELLHPCRSPGLGDVALGLPR
jgi:hypothetical protein